MVSLIKLPAELLLRVVRCLDKDTYGLTDAEDEIVKFEIPRVEVTNQLRQQILADLNRAASAKDLCSLAVVCREISPLALEILYRAPEVSNRPRDEGQCTTIHCLIRTLSRRPDLAKGVRGLAFSVLPYSPEYSGYSDHGSPYPFLEIRELCTNIIDSLDIRLWLTRKIPSTDSSSSLRCRHYQEWSRSLLKSGMFWTAVFGTALPLVPNLKTFSVNTFHVSEKKMRFWFGDAKLFPPRFINGFSSLTSLRTSFIPPWAIIKTPTLRTLHIDLSIFDPMNASNARPARRYNIPDGDICQNIQTLILVLNISILDTIGHPSPLSHEFGVYYDLRTVQRHLENLKHLQIHLSYDEESSEVDWELPWEACYGDLIPYFEATTLESITIDTARVDWAVYKVHAAYWDFPHRLLLPHACNPIFMSRFYAESWNLPSLRRFVAPQEAFFRADLCEQSQWRPVSLPSSVESVEVIDSSRALNCWAKYVLEHPLEFPSLSRVVLWCDRLAVPLSPDDRLKYDEHEGGVGDDTVRLENPAHLPQGEDEYDVHSQISVWTLPDDMKLDDVGDAVWEQLRLAGIDLIVHFKQDQGWRDM